MSGLLRAEVIKLRSTLSPRVCVLLSVLLGVGFAVLVAVVTRTDPTIVDDIGGPVQVILGGINAAQTTMLILAVLAVGAEYRFELIRSSLAVCPRRLRFLGAKLAVLGALGLVVGLVTVGVALAIVNPILALDDHAVGLSDATAVRALLAVGPLFALTVVLAAAVAFIVRQPTAGIAIVVVLQVLVEPILNAIPIVRDGARFLPFSATAAMIGTGGGTRALSPWVGFAVGLGWTVALVAAAAALLQRRDA